MRRLLAPLLPAPLLLLPLVPACSTAERVTRDTTHFDPISGTTITDDNAVVNVVGLDDVDVCWSVDGGDPGYGDSCVATLEGRSIPLTCGFHVVTIRWAADTGAAATSEEATYLVDGPSCADVEGPVSLWQNDELARAFIAIGLSISI